MIAKFSNFINENKSEYNDLKIGDLVLINMKFNLYLYDYSRILEKYINNTIGKVIEVGIQYNKM